MLAIAGGRPEVMGLKRKLTLENATEGLTVPFHKGAAKYFKEKGIEVATK